MTGFSISKIARNLWDVINIKGKCHITQFRKQQKKCVKLSLRKEKHIILNDCNPWCWTVVQDIPTLYSKWTENEAKNCSRLFLVSWIMRPSDSGDHWAARNRDDRNFLSRVISGDESWVYVWLWPWNQAAIFVIKDTIFSMPREAHQVCSNIKSMPIVFFDIRGIVHKDIVSSCQTVNGKFHCIIFQMSEGNYEVHTGSDVEEQTLDATPWQCAC